MALEQSNGSLQERKRSYRVIYRHLGRQHFVPIGLVSPEEAEAKSAQVGYLLMRIKQGLIELPPGVGIAEFIEHDGKPPTRLTLPSGGRTSLIYTDEYDIDSRLSEWVYGHETTCHATGE